MAILAIAAINFGLFAHYHAQPGQTHPGRLDPNLNAPEQSRNSIDPVTCRCAILPSPP
jgi:hypothetical protein